MTTTSAPTPTAANMRVPRQKIHDWSRIDTLILPVLPGSTHQPIPMFSVCIVVRDRPALLQKAIQSVLRSRWQDFEIIVVDDGSTIPARDVLGAVGLTADSRVRVVRQPPSGISPARNLALHASRGEFITVLDSDDELTPDGLSHLREILTRTGSHWVYCDYQELAEGKGRVIRLPTYEAPEKMLLAVLTRPRLPFKHSGMTIRRGLLAQMGGYDESIRLFEDIELVLRGLRAGVLPQHLAQPIVRFHRHNGNITRQRRIMGIGVWFQLIDAFRPARSPGFATGVKMLRAMSELGKWLVRIGG